MGALVGLSVALRLLIGRLVGLSVALRLLIGRPCGIVCRSEIADWAPCGTVLSAQTDNRTRRLAGRSAAWAAQGMPLRMSPRVSNSIPDRLQAIRQLLESSVYLVSRRRRVGWSVEAAGMIIPSCDCMIAQSYRITITIIYA